MLFQARSMSVPVSPSFFVHFTTTSTWVPAGSIVIPTPFTVSPARQAVMCWSWHPGIWKFLFLIWMNCWKPLFLPSASFVKVWKWTRTEGHLSAKKTRFLLKSTSFWTREKSTLKSRSNLIPLNLKTIVSNTGRSSIKKSISGIWRWRTHRSTTGSSARSHGPAGLNPRNILPNAIGTTVWTNAASR